MKFDKILEINKNLIKIKEENKMFNLELGLKLIYNLNTTNLIVDKQNEKLNNLISDIGTFDGYDYIVEDNEELKSKYRELYDEDIECDLLIITNNEAKGCQFDLTTLELIKPILK